MTTAVRPEREAFFLRGSRGGLLAMHTRPGGNLAPTEALLLVPAFAEEMNKSRRMLTLGADALAGAGVATLVVDLFGCGDSAGELGDATLDVWFADLELAYGWLEERHRCPVGLWGLRLGGLLARKLCDLPAVSASRVLLWQPVTRGEAALNEFLRLKSAASLIGSGGGASAEGDSTSALRARLRDGLTLEVAGYELAPQLGNALGELAFEPEHPPPCPVDWLEVVRERGRPLLPGSRRIIEGWRAAGGRVAAAAAVGEPFWRTLEIAQSQALLDATVRQMTGAASPDGP